MNPAALVGILKSRVTWLVAALALAVAASAYVTHKIHVANEIQKIQAERDALSKARAEDARQAAISQARSALVEVEIATINGNSNRIKRQIREYQPAHQPAAASGPSHDAPGSRVLDDRPQAVCGPDLRFLSRGELWLLDLAREARAPDSPAPFGDGEGAAPSDVTRDEFIQNDLEVVQRFNRLKRKHDELVDYVLELQREQRERLGATE